MKKFMIIWLGELISSIGSGMTAFAVTVYVHELTGSATWVSIVALLAFLPTMLLSPVGGILADRYDRRLMMILGDSLSVIGLIFIFVSIQAGYTGVLPICIGVTISGVFVSLLNPAYNATITDLLTEDEYTKASSLVQIAGSSRYLISPAIAGLILSFTDIRTILIIDMATIVVTVVAVSTVRKSIVAKKTNVHKSSLVDELKEGFSYIAKDKGVKNLVILMTFMCFFVGFLQTLITPMVLSFADAKTLGIMESVSAVGMLIGSVIVGVLNIKKNNAKVLMCSLMVAGLFIAMVGITTKIVFIVIACTLFFIALPFINTSADVLIRKRIPNSVQGRVWGLISNITQVGIVLAYMTCGMLADYVFSPLLMEDGVFAGSIGRLIGTGEGRGIGFMLMVIGFVMCIFAFIFGSKECIRQIERGISNELVGAEE